MFLTLIKFTLPNVLFPRRRRDFFYAAIFWELTYCLVFALLFSHLLDSHGMDLFRQASLAGLAFAPFVGVQMVQALRNRDMTRVITRSAQTDPLTGLRNRRGFFFKLAEEGPPVRQDAVLIVDIDLFKQVNDEHGHQVGDDCLVQVGDYLRSQIRKSDTVCRYGGEEFAIVLRDTSVNKAQQVAQRICDGKTFICGSVSLPLTFSIGIARWHAYASLDTSLQRADHALFNAKRGGRSQAYIHATAFSASGV